MNVATFWTLWSEYDYDYEYEYEFFNVYPVRMPYCVRLSRQLVLSSKSRRRLDANYEIFNKSRPPTTSSLQVQRQVKRLVFKGAVCLLNIPATEKSYNFALAKITEIFLLQADDGNNSVYDS